MKPIYRSYLIEINLGSSLPGTGSQIYIKDYPTLRDVFFMGAVSYSSTTLAVAPSGQNCITATGEQQIAATFVDKFNQEIIRNYPLRDLDPYFTGGFYRDFTPFPFQLTKSYITINATTGLTANESIVLNIFYLTPKDVSSSKR